MKNITNLSLHLFSIYAISVYFLYTIILTIYNFNHLTHLDWEQALNQTTTYSSRRSTTITYIFEKDSIRISRKYPGLIEGINTWLWGIDKTKYKENISFYIRNKDYEKIRNNQIPYKKDILGNTYPEKETIPFFGLRKINLYSDNFFLFLDIWKYNFSIILSLFIILAPYIIIAIVKKIFNRRIKINENIELQKKIGGYIIIYFIIYFLNFII